MWNDLLNGYIWDVCKPIFTDNINNLKGTFNQLKSTKWVFNSTLWFVKNSVKTIAGLPLNIWRAWLKALNLAKPVSWLSSKVSQLIESIISPIDKGLSIANVSSK